MSSERSSPRKRGRTDCVTKSVECKIYVSYNKGMAPIDAFKELISNAYDAHTMNGLDPQDIKISTRKTEGGCIWTVENQGESISQKNFNLQQSQKQQFRRDSTGGNEYPQGNFGQGLKRALSRLLCGAAAVIYETSDTEFVFLPKIGPDCNQLNSAMKNLGLSFRADDQLSSTYENANKNEDEDGDVVMAAKQVDKQPPSSNNKAFTRTHVLCLSSFKSLIDTKYEVSENNFQKDAKEAEALFLYACEGYKDALVFTVKKKDVRVQTSTFSKRRRAKSM